MACGRKGGVCEGRVDVYAAGEGDGMSGASEVSDSVGVMAGEEDAAARAPAKASSCAVVTPARG